MDSSYRATSSMMMTLVYDTHVLENENNPSVTQLNELEQRLTLAARPGTHLVEFFTWMKYLPSWMAKWKREALGNHTNDSIMLMRLYDYVCQRMDLV